MHEHVSDWPVIGAYVGNGRDIDVVVDIFKYVRNIHISNY